MNPKIIAIDGPSASGKGTLARRLAAHYGYAYLDSGKLYRAAALHLKKAGGDPGDERAAVRAAMAVAPEDLSNPDLTLESTAKLASRIAGYPKVREALLGFQRGFASHPPAGKQGVVMDGRDIGTVVCPKADVKLFVTASSEERARRRHAEMQGKGTSVSVDEILADIERRDRQDRERSIAPLVRAEDAHLLDTTKLDIEAAFQAAQKVIDRHLKK